MTAQEFQALLIEGGLSQDDVSRLTGNSAITSRISQLRQASEYSAIEQKANALAAEKAALESELNGSNGKPGSKAYQKWYAENYEAIEANKRRIEELNTAVQTYEAAYGKIANGAAPVVPAGITKDEINTLIQAQTQSFAPKVVSSMTGIAKVIERHMKRGRSHEIDWDKLDQIAADPKIGGDPVAAYEEWDRPNLEKDREAAAAKAEEDIQKRIDAKVQEELKRRNVPTSFPAGADGSSATTGVMSPLSKAAGQRTYDPSKVLEAFHSVQ